MCKTLTAFLDLLTNNIFLFIFYKFFSTYIKTTKERLQKIASERYQTLSEEETFSGSNAKIYQKMKKSWFSIEKNTK